MYGDRGLGYGGRKFSLTILSRLLVAMLATFVVQAACGDASNRPAASYPFSADADRAVAAFADVFQVVDTLVMTENDSVVIGSPLVRFDGEDFVMADLFSAQVRLYTRRGELLWARGQHGDGPGEFLSPVSARRTTDGRVVVADISATRATYFEPTSDLEPATADVPFLTLDYIDVGDGRRLIVGEALGASIRPQSMLHLWDAASRTVERSFMADPFPPELAAAWENVLYVDAQVARDTIWAVSALSDSVYAFLLDGASAGTVPLPLSPQPETDGDLAPLWLAAHVHMLDDGDIAVQLYDVDMETQARTWHLAVVGRDGAPKALLRDTPKLYVVANDLFYFQSPDHLEPNRWIAARRKGG